MRFWGPKGEFLGNSGPMSEMPVPTPGALLGIPVIICFVIFLMYSCSAQNARDQKEAEIKENRIATATANRGDVANQLGNAVPSYRAGDGGVSTSSSGSDGNASVATSEFVTELLKNDDNSRKVELGHEEIVQFATEYMRRWYPKWHCVSRESGYLNKSYPEMKVAFALNNPRNKKEESYRCMVSIPWQGFPRDYQHMMKKSGLARPVTGSENWD